MKKTKSDVLLETFTKSELKQFNSFILCKLQGKSRDVLKYWTSKYSAKSGKISYAQKGSVSRKTLSDFNKQVERFLVFNNIEKDELGAAVSLVRELRKRNIEKYSDQLLKDISKFRHDKFKKGYQNTLALLKLNFEEYLLHNSRSDEDRMYKTTKERVKLSEIIAVYNKLFEYLNDVYFSPEKTHKDTGLVKIKDVVDYLEVNSTYIRKYYPNVWTMYLIYLTLEDSSSYERIIITLDYFEKHESRFSEEFLQFGYETLLRLIFSKMNTGSHQAFEDIYRIILKLENSGTIKNIPHFQPRILPGFVVVSLNLGNLALAEKIVNDYSLKVIESFRDQAVKVSKAMIELAKGNYDNVKELLENLKPHDPMLYIFCKSTLLKAYYENNDFKYIYPVTDAVKHFLQRRSDVTEVYSSVLKFLYYINKLTVLKKNHNKCLNDIENPLSKENYFFQKKWIIEKFNQLKSSVSSVNI